MYCDTYEMLNTGDTILLKNSTIKDLFYKTKKGFSKVDKLIIVKEKECEAENTKRKKENKGQ